MQHEYRLFWFLIPLIIFAIVHLYVMNRDSSRTLIKKIVLDRLAKGPARENDLRSMLSREGILVSEKKFRSVMNELLWDAEVDKDDDRWMIEPKQSPGAVKLSFKDAKDKAHARVRQQA